VPLEINYYI